MAKPKPVLERFMDKFIPEPMSGCWLWVGPVNGNGYGWLSVAAMNADKPTRYDSAHRVSYRIFHGEIPDDMQVCHKCDVPICVNPDHLFLGSVAVNAADRNSKGRHAHGARNAGAKLTESQARMILARTDSSQVLAEEFGVTRGAIWRLRSGKNWRHLHG